MAGNETNDKAGDKMAEKVRPLPTGNSLTQQHFLLFTMVKKRTSLHRVVVSILLANALVLPLNCYRNITRHNRYIIKCNRNSYGQIVGLFATQHPYYSKKRYR